MSKNQLKKEIILVVDDSPDTVNMLSEALEEQGYDILVALDGTRALSVCKRIVPDLILMDAIMPNMNGFEAAKKILQDPRLATTPIIFITGTDSDENMITSFQSGAVDYIQKPVNLTELYARIKVHILKSKELSNARKMLDDTGSACLAFDNQGQMLWATPQAYDELEKTGADRITLAMNLSRELQKWLPNSTPSQIFSCIINEHKIELTLKKIDDNAWVFIFGNEQADHAITHLSEEEAMQKLKEHFELSERESEVLYWLSKGKTNKELAIILDISPRTINKHLENIFAKLLVENRTSAANIAINCLNGNNE